MPLFDFLCELGRSVLWIRSSPQKKRYQKDRRYASTRAEVFSPPFAKAAQRTCQYRENPHLSSKPAGRSASRRAPIFCSGKIGQSLVFATYPKVRHGIIIMLYHDATRSKGGADNHCSFDIHSFLIYTQKNNSFVKPFPQFQSSYK